MRKLRIGLRLTADHYLPEEIAEERQEGHGTPKWRTLQAKQLWSANMHRASSIKQAWRSAPKARRTMQVEGAGANDAATINAKYLKTANIKTHLKKPGILDRDTCSSLTYCMPPPVRSDAGCRRTAPSSAGNTGALTEAVAGQKCSSQPQRRSGLPAKGTRRDSSGRAAVKALGFSLEP